MVHEVRVDVGLGESERLVSPSLEFTGVNVGRFDGEISGEGLSLGGVPLPVRVVERSVGVAGVLVDDRVVDLVKVADTIDAGVDPL